MNDQKQYEVEWSFSFEKIGESISKMLGSVDEEAKTMTLCEPRGSAQSLEFHLHPAIGTTTVGSNAGADCLIDGQLTYVGEIEHSSNGADNRVVTLKQKRVKDDLLAPVRRAVGAFNRREDLKWDLNLTPAVPTRLIVNGGVGPVKLNLTAIHLTEVRLQGGVGEMRLCLPATDAGYNASLNGGVGENHVYVPANAAIQLRVDGGVGRTTVHIAPNTAVRVVAEGGLGSVDIPNTFKRLKKDNDFISQGGVWESEGFALSNRQVTITYKGGVGAFQLIQDGAVCG